MTNVIAISLYEYNCNINKKKNFFKEYYKFITIKKPAFEIIFEMFISIRFWKA